MSDIQCAHGLPALTCEVARCQEINAYVDRLTQDRDRYKGILLLGREIGKSFSGPGGAIIAHGQECRFYTLLSRGETPGKNDCTCKAKKAAEKLLNLMTATKELEC